MMTTNQITMMTTTKTTPSKSYGLTLAGATQYFDLSQVESDDLTLMAAQGLAMAYQAVAALGGDSKYVNGFKGCLERAWRVLLYLRSKQPVETLDEDVFTRFGRFRETLVVEKLELDVEKDSVFNLVDGVDRPIYRPKERKRRRKIKR